MSDSDVRPQPPTEVLDLYDVLPQRAVATQEPVRSAEDDPVTSMIKSTGRNLAVIIGLFALSLAAFVVCTTLFSLGVGLLVLVVGLFILVACLIFAGWSSRMTMALLGYAGITLPPTRYPAGGPGFRGKLRRLVYPQSWRDLLHVLVNFILSTITFSLALTWVFGGLRHLLVLEPLAAAADRGPAGAARLSRPVRRTHLQYRARRASVDHSSLCAAWTRPAAWGSGVRTAGGRDAGSASAGQRSDP